MNDQDKNQFKQIFVGVGEIYNKEITKSLLSVYFQSLKNYSIEQVADALSKHLNNPNNGQFFPKPADIVRILTPKQRSQEDMAAVAWMEIEANIRRIGAYGTLEMEDKQALAAVKALGSWQSLCHTPENKMAFKRQEFIKNYQSLDNTPLELLPRKLYGIEDLSNMRKNEASQAQALLQQLEERQKS